MTGLSEQINGRNGDLELPNPPFFIVGVGRSGTTLLMSMLNAHPEVVLPPESHFLRRHVISDKPTDLDEVENRLSSDKYFARLELEPAELADYFRESELGFSWPLLYRLILSRYRRKRGKPIIGDKDPKSIEYLPVLRWMFPDSRVLHMVRDPRDVVLSREKAGWSRNRSWLSHLLAYRTQFNLGRRKGRELFDQNYLEIQYEKLITEPEKTLREVSKFLGIKYTDQMLAFSESAEELVAPDEKDWKQNVTGPLQQDNYRKWEDNLSRREIVRIEGVCRRVFDQGLYKIAYPELTFSEWLERQVLKVGASIASKLYLTRREIQIRKFLFSHR